MAAKTPGFDPEFDPYPHENESNRIGPVDGVPRRCQGAFCENVGSNVRCGPDSKRNLFLCPTCWADTPVGSGGRFWPKGR